MKKITLLIDLDCILVNMLPAWLDKYNDDTGENIKVSDVIDYDVRSICRDIEALDKIIHEPGFFNDLVPMPHGPSIITKLMTEGYDIVFVTQAPRGSDFAIRDKKEWIRKHFSDFNLENVVFCHRKELIRGDLLFDDKPSHLRKWFKNNSGGYVATIDWPYNRETKVHFRGDRSNGWLNFYDFVHKVLPLT